MFWAKVSVFSFILILHQTGSVPVFGNVGSEAMVQFQKVANSSENLVAGSLSSESFDNLRAEVATPLRAMMKNLLSDATERLSEFRKKAACVQNYASKAFQGATHEFQKASNCSVESVQKTVRTISTVSSDLEKSIYLLVDIGSKLRENLAKCVSEKPASCAIKAFSSAESAVVRVADSVRISLKQGTKIWRTLSSDLTTCFEDGTEQVTSVERHLREQIIQCISPQSP